MAEAVARCGQHETSTVHLPCGLRPEIIAQTTMKAMTNPTGITKASLCILSNMAKNTKNVRRVLH